MALLTFWVGVVTSNNNILPFAIEEVMTVSFLVVILMGYIFVEIEFTSDFLKSSSSGSGNSNGRGYRKILGTAAKPVFAQQLLDRKPTAAMQFLRKSQSAFSLLLQSAKKLRFNKRNEKSDVEKKISDMFADSAFKLPKKASTISNETYEATKTNDSIEVDEKTDQQKHQNISI
jgi:hypothetical protein